jgi:formate dehydrogenase maturation protein FdhE
MSLVTTPASKLGLCATCASTRVTAITMTLTDGSVVDFVSCHTCETKSWKQAGTELDISAVLGKAKKTKVAA